MLASLAAIAVAFALSDRVDGAIRREPRRPPGPSWRDEPRPWVIGHRGGGADALDEPLPENSIASAMAALAEGATGVELDATLTRDGQLLLLHDPDLDRTTTCSGCASELTMNDIRECRTVTPVESNGAAATHDERPPTLGEAMSAVGMRDDDSKEDGVVEVGAATRFDGVAVPIDDVDRVAGAARAQGRLVDAYVANDAEAALEAARQGADFIETDRVREVLIALGRREPRASPTR